MESKLKKMKIYQSWKKLRMKKATKKAKMCLTQAPANGRFHL